MHRADITAFEDVGLEVLGDLFLTAGVRVPRPQAEPEPPLVGWRMLIVVRLLGPWASPAEHGPVYSDGVMAGGL